MRLSAGLFCRLPPSKITQKDCKRSSRNVETGSRPTVAFGLAHSPLVPATPISTCFCRILRPALPRIRRHHACRQLPLLVTTEANTEKAGSARTKTIQHGEHSEPGSPQRCMIAHQGLWVMRFLLTVLLFSLATLMAEDWKTWFKRGAEAYHKGSYQEAANSFRVATEINPKEFLPRLYLGMSWYNEYRYGEQSLGNPEIAQVVADNAETALTQALELHPNDLLVLESLAFLNFQQAMRNSMDDPQRFDKAVSWYHKLIAADPLNQEAYYMLGLIAWSKSFPVYMRARARLSMKPGEGPIQDANVKEELKAHLPEIEEGISNLEKALEIDPEYDGAMSQMQLLIRERAELRDTVDEYQRDTKTADQWAETARDAKKRNSEDPVRSASVTFTSLPTLPDDPQANPKAGGRTIRFGIVPSAIRVAAKRQEANLIRKVELAYPPLARDSRIQGTVRLRITIDAKGDVTSMKVISGDPLLIEAAQDAVGQWKYKPALFNEFPVCVVTTVDVRFTLDGG